MSFHLLEYARERRYRVRNLHDGRPLHPLRIPVMRRGRSDGYVGEEDREDAIIGYRGYVRDDGDGRLAWYVFGKQRKTVQGWVRELQAAGAVVKQDCDLEAAGDAPVEAIEVVLGIIRPYQVKPPNLSNPLIGRESRARMNATASGGVSGHPGAK